MDRWQPLLFIFAVALLFLVGSCTDRGAGSGDKVYSHRVQAGETLSDIAESYYGEPTRADEIGKLNNIEEYDLVPEMEIKISMTTKEIERFNLRKKARVPYNRGLVLVEQGSYLDAVQFFQGALEIDPEFIDARYNLGVTLQKMKSYEKALDQFEKIVRKRSTEPKYYFALGTCLFYLERYGRSVDAFKKVMELDPGHVKSLYSLAVSYEKVGDRKKAKESWQRYLELDDRSAWAAEARKHLQELE